MANIKDCFDGKETINVVFLGGSITEGAGASAASECFANKTGEWIKDVFGRERVNVYNKGVGGTPSMYGLLRFDRDVAFYEPDMLFVEFAVNDENADTRRFVEGIVRRTLSLPKIPYVVFLYTTNEDYTTDTRYFEEVAEYYGIPQINLKNALKEHLKGMNAREAGYLCDSVHPSDKGYQVYFDEMVRCLKNEKYFTKPKNNSTPLTENCCIVKGEFIPAYSVTKKGTWHNGENGTRRYIYGTVNSTLEFEFEGSALAFEQGLHKDSAAYEIFDDGQKIGFADAARKNFTTNQMVMGYRNFELENKHHNIKVVVVPSDAGFGNSSQLTLYNIITAK